MKTVVIASYWASPKEHGKTVYFLEEEPAVVAETLDGVWLEEDCCCTFEVFSIEEYTKKYGRTLNELTFNLTRRVEPQPIVSNEPADIPF